MKSYFKSKRFRKLKKEWWLNERRRMKKDGTLKLRIGNTCTCADPLDCKCEPAKTF